jgi:hypothetical protein
VLRARDLCGGRLVTGVPTAKDKLVELRFGKLHGNGRGSGLFGRHGHNGMTLFEEGFACLSETLSSNKIIL